MMKKILLMIVMIFAAGIAMLSAQPDTTTLVIPEAENLKDFLLQLWKNSKDVIFLCAVIAAQLWAAETTVFPEGSIWRKVLNLLLAFLKKQVTKSPKMKKIEAVYLKSQEKEFKTLDLNKGFKDFTKLSKILIFALVLSGLGLSASAQKAHPFRIYPFKQELRGSAVDSTVFFGASVSFDVFTKELKTGDYSVGAIPGVGYGIKWNPKWNPLPTKSLVSLDVFAQAALDKAEVAQYFSIKLLPMVGILDWVHVGYGPVFKLGVNGTPGYNTGMFAISITTTL